MILHERLDRWQMTALIGVLTALLLPHTEHLPYWLTATVALALCWRLWLLYRQWKLPPRWLLWPLTFAMMGGILASYHTLLGKTGGVAALAALVAAKLLETRKRRDALVLIYLGYFLVITNFLFSQSLWMGAYLFIAVTATTALLVSWHSLEPIGGEHRFTSMRQHARIALTLLAQAIPLTIFLFLFFPRIEGPLWRLPQDKTTAQSGLSDSMSPGSFSRNAQSDEVAFRVSFEGDPPPQDALYWRGPVFEIYDGHTWTQTKPSRHTAASLELMGKPVRYTVTLEPHMRPWVLALDMPAGRDAQLQLTDRFQLISQQGINKRERFTLQSSLDYVAARQEHAEPLEQALQLPADTNPRAEKLAKSWRGLAPEERINEALRLFARERLTYTLTPPLYGQDAVDEFIFVGKQGFCEHFAGAFVFLMRQANVPARVVGGYQGGDRNGDYLIIRQADAHAWAEVWLEGKGWKRVDPTFAVAPSRIEQGLAGAVAASELPVMLRLDQNWIKRARLILDSAVNQWNQWVIGYTPQQQRKFLQRFGIEDLLSSQFLLTFATSIGLILLSLTGWLLWRLRPPKRPTVQRHYDLFCRKLAAKGVKRERAEGPMDYARRAAARLPAHAEAILDISQRYARIRYAGQNDELPALIAAIKQFRP